MPVSVTMPRLGESVTEGTVTRWLKQEGDHVEADEPLLEVSTDKVDTEIPAPASGVLTKIVVGEDETADVGSELAVISGDGESPDAATPAPAQSTEATMRGNGAVSAPAASPQQAAPAEEPKGDPAPAAAAPSAGGQTTAVKMPALGESVTEGTVTRWLKQVGDAVEADEPLLEVSTDKVDTEIPAPASGTLLEIKVAEDEVVPVGSELAVIGSGSGTGGGQSAPRQPAPQQPAPVQTAAQTAAPAHAQAAPSVAPIPPSVITAPQAQTPQASPPAQTRPAQTRPAQARPAQTKPVDGKDPGRYLTPLVRKLAAEQGVDPSAVTGTGVGGRIRKEDVIEAAERQRAEAAKAAAAKPAAAPSAPAPKVEPSPLRGRTEKMSRLRSIIAKRMVESLHISAQLTTVVEVDVTKIARLRDQAKAEFHKLHGVKLSFMPFFALAAVEALQVHPSVNASIDAEDGTVTYHNAEHLAIAVETGKGLMVPVIRNAGDLNLAGLAKRIGDLAERTRAMKIDPDELSGGTFTLTNTGSRGALFDTPIINQPQVGILGTGAVVKRAVVVDDPDLGELIVPRSMVYLALSYDHRLVDGADAAKFLVTVKERLEAGAFESALGLT